MTPGIIMITPKGSLRDGPTPKLPTQTKLKFFFCGVRAEVLSL